MNQFLSLHMLQSQRKRFEYFGQMDATKQEIIIILTKQEIIIIIVVISKKKMQLSY